MENKYNIDLHVHTNLGSACAELNHPDLIPAMMKKRNLHGVVITEHDMMWTHADLAKLNKIFKGEKNILRC